MIDNINANKDESEIAVITMYEEHGMLLRNVYLDDYEERIKRFVYGKPLVKLKQLEEAFKGNKYLEKIVEKDENS